MWWGWMSVCKAVEPLMMSLDFVNSMMMMVGDDDGGDE
jgi:hypothetical protein